MASSNNEYPKKSRTEIQSLVMQARHLENQGDVAGAIRYYHTAIGMLADDDPTRGQLESVVRLLEQDAAAVRTNSGKFRQQRSRLGIPVWLWGLLCLSALIAVGSVVAASHLFLQAHPASPGPGQKVIVSTPFSFAPTPFSVAPAPSLSPAPNKSSTPARVAPAVASSPTPHLASTIFFEDDFAQGLDSSKWVVDNLPRTVVDVGASELHLASTTTHFPYVHTRTDPFPASGDFRVDMTVRFPHIGTCGAPIALASFLLPPGLSQDATNRLSEAAEKSGGVSIWFWHDTVYYRSGLAREDIRLNGIATNWQVMTVEYVGGRYHLLVDGTAIYTSDPTPTRPRALWIGLPVELGGPGCNWDSVDLSQVQIQAWK